MLQLGKESLSDSVNYRTHRGRRILGQFEFIEPRSKIFTVEYSNKSQKAAYNALWTEIISRIPSTSEHNLEKAFNSPFTTEEVRERL